MCVAHLPRVVGHAGRAHCVVGALPRAPAGSRASDTFESITIDLPPGSFTITSGRSTRPSSPGIVCCSSKSQYDSIPAISITRRSWISPHWPRVCELPAQGADEVAGLRAQPLVVLADELELLVDLAVGALALLLQEAHVQLDLVERLLQRLHEHAEPAHRLLGECGRVLAQRLGRKCLDRVLDADVEGASLGGERALGLGQRALRVARLEGRPDRGRRAPGAARRRRRRRRLRRVRSGGQG